MIISVCKNAFWKTSQVEQEMTTTMVKRTPQFCTVEALMKPK
jgi:hypothetical protein